MDLPPELKEEQYDAVLVYSNHTDDVQLAVNVKEFIENCVPALEDGHKPKICVFDSNDLLYINAKFAQLGEAIKRSTYMLILVTSHFSEDAWCEIAKENCLQETIDDPRKRWCLIPLYECDKKHITFTIPSFLKIIRGIHLHSYLKGVQQFRDVDVSGITVEDTNTKQIEGLRKLFNCRIYMKRERQMKQSKAIQEWRNNQDRKNDVDENNDSGVTQPYVTNPTESLTEGVSNMNLTPSNFNPNLAINTGSETGTNTFFNGEPDTTLEATGISSMNSSPDGKFKASFLAKGPAVKQELSDRHQIDSPSYHRGPVILSKEDLKSVKDEENRSLIATGGYGKVYKGRWNDGDVAIKVIQKIDESQKERSREIAVAYLRHPFLLPVLAISDEQPFPTLLIFPYKEGGDLDTVLRNQGKWPTGSCTWKDLVRILSQTAEGLSYLHTPVPNKRGAIRHGDLKPANILLDGRGNACIGDAGLAVEIPDGRWEVTATYAQSGTCYYVDPDSNNKKTVQNDIYSFGIVLQQVLSMTIGPEYHKYLTFKQRNCGDKKETIQKYMTNYPNTVWRAVPDSIRDQLIDLALNSTDVIEKRIHIREISTKLQDMCCHLAIQRILWSEEKENLCSMCHFSAVAEMNCCQCDRARFCGGCMSYSSTNPLVCPACGPCQPLIGGEDAFALLVAGSGEQEIFTRDVLTMSQWLMDPRIMGIRKENVTCLLPKGFCKDESYRNTKSNVLQTIDEIKHKINNTKSKRKMLIMYVSCHSDKESGKPVWVLDDKLYCDDVMERFVGLNVDILLSIVDCCYAAHPVLPFSECRAGSSSFIQWSACSTREKTIYFSFGSEFTNCIISGLTSALKCPYDFKKCGICKRFRDRGHQEQCIVFSELQEFVERHFERESTNSSRIELVGKSTQLQIAYYNEDPLYTKVLYKQKSGEKVVLVLEKTLEKLKCTERLKFHIAEKLIDLGYVDAENKESVAAKLCITYTTYKGVQGEVVDYAGIKNYYDRFGQVECHLKDD